MKKKKDRQSKIRIAPNLYSTLKKKWEMLNTYTDSYIQNGIHMEIHYTVIANSASDNKTQWFHNKLVMNVPWRF